MPLLLVGLLEGVNVGGASAGVSWGKGGMQLYVVGAM